MRPPTQAEIDRALAFYRFLQHESAGIHQPGKFVSVSYGSCDVVAVIEAPRRFPRATKILHDNSPVLTDKSPANFIVRTMLRQARSLERPGMNGFDVTQLSTREGETPFEWVNRCKKAVMAWQAKNGLANADN
jgi:hypothetical protein